MVSEIINNLTAELILNMLDDKSYYTEYYNVKDQLFAEWMIGQGYW